MSGTKALAESPSECFRLQGGASVNLTSSHCCLIGLGSVEFKAKLKH